MSKKKTLTTLSIVGTAFAASLAASNVASAQESGANPFTMQELSSGYMQMAEGKCGEGKCGDSMKKGAKEGKCGEGKCGEDKKKGAKEGKCGEGKKGEKEGKCGGN